jgi:hypothetical protein
LTFPCRPNAAALLFPLLLSGCSILPTTRKLPVPKAPALTQTVEPEELVSQLNKRWAALNTMNARVDIQASQFKTNAGRSGKRFPHLRRTRLHAEA